MLVAFRPLLPKPFGVTLTLLDSANNDWHWVAPNILLSFALIRYTRPYALKMAERYGMIAYVVLAGLLVALLPVVPKVFDYGAEGWLWALLGLAQRMRSDARSAGGPTWPRLAAFKNVLISVLVCIVAAVAYVQMEQKEFRFTVTQFDTFVVCLTILALAFVMFARGPSRIKPPGFAAATMRMIGRHTLVIYALELAVFEIAIKLFPEIGP